jgi:hypothetical protein
MKFSTEYQWAHAEVEIRVDEVEENKFAFYVKPRGADDKEEQVLPANLVPLFDPQKQPEDSKNQV